MSFFAVVVGFTYLRTIDTSPSGAISLQNNASYDYVIGKHTLMALALPIKMSKQTS